MKFNRFWMFLGLVSALFMAGCSSSGGGLSDKDIATFDVSSTGDNITSASIDINDDGDLQVTFAPILDPSTGTPYGADDASKISVSAEAALASRKAVRNPLALSTDASECSADIEFGEGTASSADVAFLLDNSFSMDDMITGVANSIEDFATALNAADLDVRFALVTFADSFNTKYSENSNYTLGTGEYEPPTPLNDTAKERPLLGFTSNLTTFNSFIAEVLAAFNIGGFGGDIPENYYGVAAAMNGKMEGHAGLSPREGVPFYQILIGDNCGHTFELQGDSQTNWIPPAKADIGDVLGDGSVTIHVVRTPSTDDSCGDGISLSEIADATGGAKLDLGTGDIDLTALNLEEFITNFWLVAIDGGCIGDEDDFVLVLTVDVEDGEGATRSQTFTFTLTLA